MKICFIVVCIYQTFALEISLCDGKFALVAKTQPLNQIGLHELIEFVRSQLFGKLPGLALSITSSTESEITFKQQSYRRQHHSPLKSGGHESLIQSLILSCCWNFQMLVWLYNRSRTEMQGSRSKSKLEPVGIWYSQSMQSWSTLPRCSNIDHPHFYPMPIWRQRNHRQPLVHNERKRLLQTPKVVRLQCRHQISQNPHKKPPGALGTDSSC